MNPRESIAAFFSVAIFAPVLWMAMDRDPPHRRYDGMIMPGPVAACDQDAISGVEPGGCAEVQWQVERYRTCRPNSSDSTTRTIVDAAGVKWHIGPIKTILGRAHDANPLIRYFIIPSGATPGQATYQASSCFACNPLQDLIVPVCVSEPSISFSIAPRQQ